MKISMLKQVLMTAAVVTLALSGCQRERWSLTDETDVRRNVMAEDYFDDASTITDQAVLSEGNTMDNYKTDGVGSVLGECTTVTRDPANKTILVEFGKQPDGTYVNCLCKDGKNRRGRIEISYTGAYREAGTEITTHLVDFYVNDNHVEGTKVVKNMGQNGEGHTYFTLHADGKITLASNAGTVTWVTDREREWLEGFDTKVWEDDVYRVTGGGSGVKSNGLSCTMQITTPLIRKVACREFVSGVLQITPENKLPRVVNFGNGECDDEATVTVGNKTKTIQLKH